MNTRFTPLSTITSVMTLAICMMAQTAHAADKAEPVTAWEASRTIDDDVTIRTGVAKARDPLDSATSTSVIKDNEIERLKPTSLADLFRNIPGIRVEAASGEGNNSYTVRGLPLVGQGAKYIQFQEDGLPVMQYGDFGSAAPDSFIRADLNVAQVESIRGGSASTFSSNAPGGVINLISKTGEIEGGSVQVTGGLNYDLNRVDADYGGRLGENWRFHIGGFYRQGEGPRRMGYESMRGGQVKANITREFAGGYIRFNAKLLDDKFPFYFTVPIAVSGDNANPTFAPIPNFDPRRDTGYSRNISTYRTVESGLDNMHDDFRVKSTALGAEARITLGEWAITNRARYSNIKFSGVLNVNLAAGSASDFTNAFTGGLGGTLSYVAGSGAGQTINPATVNGNGLLALATLVQKRDNDVSNFANDIRASRVWNIGGGSLTGTTGLFFGSQRFVNNQQVLLTAFQDVVGGGNSALVNLNLPAFAGSIPVTQDGVFLYGSLGGPGGTKRANVTYSTVAPYGSFNFQTGKMAIGGSIRYDATKASGTTATDRVSVPFDVNGDGAISLPEQSVALIPDNADTPVNYSHGYVSYSVSANYRLADKFSLFARYSLGARAAGESILDTPAIAANGTLVDGSAGHDPVRQLEGGLKFRAGGAFANLTGFYALTRETALQVRTVNNVPVYSLVSRGYKTYGAELDTGIRRGPFSLAASATLTGGKITQAETSSLVGNNPRHQPTLIYRIAPTYDLNRVTIGADLIGQTSSYSQDVNLLKMPGYKTVGAFVQVRPIDKLEFSLNASNLFNTVAYLEFFEGAVPASGVAVGRTLLGRTVSASARFFF